MAIESPQLRPGMRVRVMQQIPHTIDKAWTNTVEGVVTRFRQAKTGSWYAHARHDRLWLDRLELRKDDGEFVTLVLDQYSVIESLDVQTPPDHAPEAPGAEPLLPAA
jgi:hypothetical protein